MNKTRCLLLYSAFIICFSACSHNISGNKNPLKPEGTVSKEEEYSRTTHVRDHSRTDTDANNQCQSSYQEILDSSMAFYDTATELWERGEFDSAFDALDKAYYLLVEISNDGDQNIFQQKRDMRLAISKKIMQIHASRFNAVNGLQNAIPLVMNSDVEKEIKFFQGRGKTFFITSYVRAGRYRPYIIQALEEEGLPKELSWLPLIESGFNPRALSHARALGMWQFIASTGYKFGLERNEWIDERMDPIKSTHAAIAYLKELHGIFGDWTTALAAYNCGEGNVLRVIRRQKINYLDNFWDLYQHLPRETAGYVPRFLAVLHILNNPQKYGFDLPPMDEEYQLEKVTINKQVHLKAIASNIGMSYEDLRDINPELRKSLTPHSAYFLNVPEDKAQTLTAKLDQIAPYSPPVPEYRVHVIRRGESLSVLANRYATSVKSIMAMNGLKKSNYIKEGWRLKIPTGSGRVTFTQADMSPGSTLRYVVRRGDSLWKIANSHGTTMKSIKTYNNLNTTVLSVGQVLLIPGGQSDNLVKYQVRNGDSPYLIAQRHKMRLSEFLSINNLNSSSTIFPGQKLLVRKN